MSTFSLGYKISPSQKKKKRKKANCEVVTQEGRSTWSYLCGHHWLMSDPCVVPLPGQWPEMPCGCCSCWAQRQ